MTDRERLIEICDTNCGYVDEVPAEIFADHLIAHGVIVLPCKVGDTVYYPSVKQTRCTAHGEIKDDDMCCGCEEKCDASTEPYIFSGEVARVEIIGDDVILVRCRFKEKYDNAGYVIGKTVFLTREEAEAALKKKGGDD